MIHNSNANALIFFKGNAMGYIRMMRSGGIHACSSAALFLPIVNEKLEFKSKENELYTGFSADNLEQILKLNNAEATEYFRVS